LKSLVGFFICCKIAGGAKGANVYFTNYLAMFFITLKSGYLQQKSTPTGCVRKQELLELKVECL